MAPSTSPFSHASKSPASQNTRFGSKKTSIRRNTSILQFFGKAETPPKPSSNQNRITEYILKSENTGVGTTSRKKFENNEAGDCESLFVEDTRRTKRNDATSEVQAFSGRERSQSPDDFWASIGNADSLSHGDAGDRYHENGTAVKRLKMEFGSIEVNSIQLAESEPEMVANERKPAVHEDDLTFENPIPGTPDKRHRYTGPFLIDSDNEHGMDSPPRVPVPERATSIFVPSEARTRSSMSSEYISTPALVGQKREILVKDNDSGGNDCEDLEGFVDLPESDQFGGLEECSDDEDVSVCPICQTGLKGLTVADASLHVNRCLDGDFTSVSNDTEVEVNEQTSKASLTTSELKLLARPGQKNPFKIGSTTTTSSSAFSRIMSGNAEDAAWAAAAANEVASRGKKAYERTCPFYKILPGFSICVDAFRYGAVEGCSAYFLSHFHSDHYVGLSSSWSHGPIYCSRVTGNLVRQQLKVNPKFVVDIEFEKTIEVPETGGVRVTMIPANHCPGSSIFLFEKNSGQGKGQKVQRILHCGDFRASPAHVLHPLLRPVGVDEETGQAKQRRLDVCYLDTTYLNPKYAFPCQEDVVSACAQLCVNLNENGFGQHDIWRRDKTITREPEENPPSNNDKSTEASKFRVLIVIGTYSIGKERICVAIAKALKSKIFATAAKQRICGCLEDPELSELLTDDPLEAQVHMQSLMDMRSHTLSDYLAPFKPHFTHIVGFRPTGWSYRPPAGLTDNPPVASILKSDAWKARFTVKDIVPQRGSSKESTCFGVPYSEHSSFRELTMFCCALRIAKIIPTVNVGNRKSRERMKAWIDRWETEKRKSGLFQIEDGATRW